MRQKFKISIKDYVLAFIVALILIFPTVIGLSRQLVKSDSESLVYKYFWADNSLPVQGDYVYFQFKGDEHYSNGAEFIKRIACAPGHTLTFNGYMWLCDGKILDNGVYTVTKTSKGKELPQFRFDGIIPDGKYFMLGDSMNSYDSKYWGLVDKSAVITRLIPLW